MKIASECLRIRLYTGGGVGYNGASKHAFA